MHKMCSQVPLDSVKKHADFVSATNNEEGIAKGIAYFQEEFICD